MRPLEWLVAAIVVVIAWHWLRGRRVGRPVALVGLVAVLGSAAIEGARAAMAPAYAVVVLAVLIATLRPAPAGPPRRGWLRATGRLVLAVVVLVLGVALPWLWPVMPLPTPSGPYAVGTTWIVVTDTTRAERFTTTPGGRREFPVRIWYPAPGGTTGDRAPYALPEEGTAAGVVPLILARQVTLAKTHAYQDAPVAEGRAPVLVFSHGYTGFAAQNTPQMEDLASRGYVVASIAHPGEAAVAPFPDGRRILLDTSITNANQRMVDSARRFKLDIERMMDSIGQALSVPDRATRQANFRGFLAQAEEPLRSQSVREWALDTRALVDRLEQLDQGVVPSPFQGRLDLQRLGVFGMSYGGATAGEFCMEDARCKAAINIDGGQYGRLVDDSLMVPLLILGSSQAPGVHVPVLDMVRGPAWLAVVPATTHIGLTDMTLMGPVLFRWLGVTGKLDPDYREAIMTGYVTGFFEKFLRGQPALFDSLPTRFPDVTVTTRNVP